MERKRRSSAYHGSGQLKNRKFNQEERRMMDWDSKPPTQEYFDELFRVSKNQIIFGLNYFYLPPTRCIVVWDKKQAWTNFSQAEVAWTSFNRPAKIFRRANNTGGKIHPTQKPVQIYDFLLQEFAEPGDKILDTHVGSGSSRIACWNAGLDFTGYEIDEFYFTAEEERFRKVCGDSW